MLPYWLLLVVLSLGALVHQEQQQARVTGVAAKDYRIRDNVLLLFVLIVITLMIGLRYRVGGDWTVYSRSFFAITSQPLGLALHRSPDEFAYTLINWVAGELGFGLWFVNLICALPFMVGLAAICRQQPNPWLALVVATPLFIIVVAMGFTRQAAAAGFMLIGMAGLTRGKSYLRFVGWTLVGALFHQTVLVLIPLVAMVMFRATMFSVVLGIASLIVTYYFIVPNALERYSHGYIENVYQAKGAIFRIGTNALAAFILLTFRKQFKALSIELKVWRGWAWFTVPISAAFFIVRSTVILDRLSLYILPLQIFVFSRIPTAFGTRSRMSIALTGLIIAYSAGVLFLWLNFANHARFWVPYRLWPLN